MKKFKLLILTVMLASAGSMSAQKVGLNTNGWQSVWFHWNPSKVKSEYSEFNNNHFNSISLGYSRAFGVSKSLPLYLEGGLGIQYSYDKETKTTAQNETQTLYKTIKYKGLSAQVPVKLMYRWDIPSSKLALIPYLGANFRFNILATQRIEEVGIEGQEIAYKKRFSLDCFDDDDMVSTWNRFQAGWEFGFKINYNRKCTLGFGWGRDFNDLAKNSKVRYREITLEYNF